MKKVVFILACVAVLVAMVIPVFAAGATEVTTAQQLKDALQAGESVKLAADIDVGEFTGSALSVPNNVSAKLDLNGYTLSGVKTGTKNGEVIHVGFGANLEVSDSVGTGAIVVSSTDDGEWGCYTAAIAVNGACTVKGGSIINNGGTAMAYAIDVLANGSAGPSLTVEGGLLKSTYIATRGFVNNTTSGVLTINVSGGVIEGGNRGIWIQQPNSNAGKNFAAVNVSGGYIYGGKAAIDLYMATTADSANSSPEVTVSITGGMLVNNNMDTPTVVINGSSTSMNVPVRIANAVLFNENPGENIGDRRDYGPSNVTGAPQFSFGDGVSCNCDIDYSLVISVTSDINFIKEKPVKGVYDIDTFGLSNLSLEGNPVAYEGVSYVGKLVVTGGSDFTLPNDITVKVDGNEIKGFTYNATTGEIIIDAYEITGEIAIEAQAICTSVTVEITSPIKVGEENSIELDGENGPYVSYYWFEYGTFEAIVNYPEKGVYNEYFQGDFNRLIEMYPFFEIMSNKDNQSAEQWLPSSDLNNPNVYDASIIMYVGDGKIEIPVQVVVEQASLQVNVGTSDIFCFENGYGACASDCYFMFAKGKDYEYEHFTVNYGDSIVAQWPTEAGKHTVSFEKTITYNGEEYTKTFNLNVIIYSIPTTPTKCGDDMTWIFDKETQTLTISGTGDMYDVFEMEIMEKYPLWWELPIKHIVIEEGVESISDNAFLQAGVNCNYDMLETITLPTTLKALPEGLVYSTAMESIVIPNGITEITGWVFGVPGNAPMSIKTLYIPATVTKIDLLSIGFAGVDFDAKKASYDAIHFAGTKAQWEAIEWVNSDAFTKLLGDMEQEYRDMFGEFLADVEIICAPDTFTVTWVDENGNVVDTEVVEAGKSATKNPTVPAKEGYTGKWDKVATEVNADVTIEATYTVNSYTVTWVDEKGNVVDTEIVEYSKSATKNPLVPAKEGYTGKWDKAATEVKADVTVTATYTVKTFTVTWVDENGNVVDTEIVEYSKSATKNPLVPAKEGFTGKWDKVATDVKADVTVTATYTENIVVDDKGAATIPDSVVDVEEGKDIVIEVIIPSVDDNTGSGDNTGSDDNTGAGDGEGEGTGSQTPVTPVEPPKVESVVIGSATVDKITQAEVKVEIKLPEITVSFDKEAIGSIGEQSQSKDVTIVATEVEKEELNEEQQTVLEEKEIHLVLKLEVHAEDEKITEFGGGTVTISVPFEVPEGKDASEFTVAYIADDGTVTIMPTTFENGVLSFETTHFSKYVVMETAQIDSPVTGDNTMLHAVVAMLVISMAVIAVAAVSKKRCM